MIEKHTFFGWNGYRISNGEVTLGVVPQIGGRIISLCYRGQELFFVQPEHAGETFDFSHVADLCAEKRQMGFRIWGGDKTWIAPEKLWLEKIPPLELDAGNYSFTILDEAVEMISPFCRETGAQITRRVELTPDGGILLEQTILNASSGPIRRGIWNVTQLLRPQEFYFQAHPHQVRAYDDEGYEEAGAKVVALDDGWMKISCDDRTHFKIGAILRQGVVIARCPDLRAAGETVSLTKTFSIDPGAAYAHDSMIEIFNSPRYDYAEVEIHGPLAELAPGESRRHRQEWRIESGPNLPLTGGSRVF